MKIIFDSEEDKKSFFKGLYQNDVCPDDLGIKADHCLDAKGCKSCLEKAILHEVIS